MNKQKQKISISIILAVCFGFLVWQNVLAAGLVVKFEKTPLFSEANILPGNEITRWIKITNNDTTSHKIIVEAINTSDPNNLASQLNLTIKEGATNLYTGTLKDFFEKGEYQLLNLSGNGSKTQYDFSVNFNQTADNDYQGKTLSFDFLAGFQGQEGGGGTIYGSMGGGGGGGGLPPGLTILDESVTTTVSALCQATIYWSTTYFSTSQVVFDTSPGKFDLTAGPPKYGYAYLKEGDDSGQEKVTAHQVTLYGLTSGETYYYRAISHASPDTISRQYSFVMCPCSQQNPQNPEKNPVSPQPLAFNPNQAAKQVLGANQEMVPYNEIATAPATTQENATNTNFLADIGNFFNKSFACLKCLPWWVGIILTLLAVQKIIWLFEKAKKEQSPDLKNKFKNAGFVWIITGIACLACALFFYFAKACFYQWLIIIFFALHILIYQFLTPSKNEPQQKKKINYFALVQVIILILAVVLDIFSRCLPLWLIFIILAIIFVNNKR